ASKRWPGRSRGGRAGGRTGPARSGSSRRSERAGSARSPSRRGRAGSRRGAPAEGLLEGGAHGGRIGSSSGALHDLAHEPAERLRLTGAVERDLGRIGRNDLGRQRVELSYVADLPAPFENRVGGEREFHACGYFLNPRRQLFLAGRDRDLAFLNQFQKLRELNGPNSERKGFLRRMLQF